MSGSASSHAAFWSAACDAVPELPPDAPYQVWHFGDTETLARALAGLVLRGTKRATAGLLWDAENDPNAMPAVGGYSVVTDFGGDPLLIIRTTNFEIRPYHAVDEDFARAEGEGDGSLVFWRTAHWEYFARRCAALDRPLSEDMPVILERFVLIYPLAEHRHDR